MRKKFFFMSVMLMGLVSLFTSCVDVDCYDLYEDEEDSFIPRNKKGKGDLNEYDNYDYSDYPLMELGWETAECVACCLSQFYPNKSKAWCRRNVIEAQYGCFNMNSYGAYFYSVMNAINMPDGNVQNTVLGGTEYYTASYVQYLINKYGTGTITCNNVHLALYNVGLGHISRVNSVSISTNSYGGHDVTFTVTDQHGSNTDYYANIRDGKMYTNVGRFRECR